MNAFKLKIKKKSMYTHTLEQIYAYLDCYMGEEGLTEIGNNLSQEEVNKILGEFASSMYDNKHFDEEYIYGIAIFEDDFRSFIQCLYAEKIPFPHTNKEVILRWA